VVSGYAVACGARPASFGLIALRRGAFARLFVAVGSLSLVFINVAPLARALTMSSPPRVHSLHALTVPTFQFPAMRVPTATAAPTHAATASTTAPLVQAAAGQRAARHVVRVPVIKDLRDLRPAAPPTKTAQITAAQPATTVTSSVGVEPVGFGGTSTAPAASPAL